MGLRCALHDDASERARIQIVAIRDQADEYYSKEQIAPSDHRPENIDHAVFDDDDYYAVIAEDDSEIVGFSVVHSDEGYLSDIFVDPNYIGNGIGKKLLRNIEKVTSEENIQSLKTYAALNTVGFYESCGFRITEEIDANRSKKPEIPAVGMKNKANDNNFMTYIFSFYIFTYIVNFPINDIVDGNALCYCH